MFFSPLQTLARTFTLDPLYRECRSAKEKNWNFGGTETEKMIDEFIGRVDSYERRPQYLGFGEMLAFSPASMVLVAVRSLSHAGERGIIVGGHAELSMELLLRATNDKEVIAYRYAKERVLFLAKVSHAKLLFPSKVYSSSW